MKTRKKSICSKKYLWLYGGCLLNLMSQKFVLTQVVTLFRELPFNLKKVLFILRDTA